MKILSNIFPDCRGRLAGFALLLSALLGLMASLSGCTHNNGNIGDWFGRWQIMEIKVDGVAMSGYEPVYFLDFQNNILRGIEVGDDGYDRNTRTFYGTWKEVGDNAVSFDFNHRQDDGTWNYTPFPILHFPSDGAFNLSVVDKSSTKRTLIYNAPDGVEYSYVLRKR